MKKETCEKLFNAYKKSFFEHAEHVEETADVLSWKSEMNSFVITDSTIPAQFPKPPKVICDYIRTEII